METHSQYDRVRYSDALCIQIFNLLLFEWNLLSNRDKHFLLYHWQVTLSLLQMYYLYYN